MPLEPAIDDRVADLRRDLVAAQNDLLGILDPLNGDDWQALSPNEGWTVHSLLTHLSTAEAGFVTSITRQSRGEGGVPKDFDPNRWNAAQLRRHGDVPPSQLLTNLRASHAQMLALLDAVDAVQLAQRGHMSVGREGSLEDVFRLVARHKRSHTRDIQAALDARA